MVIFIAKVSRFQVMIILSIMLAWSYFGFLQIKKIKTINNFCSKHEFFNAQIKSVSSSGTTTKLSSEFQRILIARLSSHRTRTIDLRVQVATGVQIISLSFNSSKNVRYLLLDEVLIISQQSWLILKGFTSQFVNILLIFTNLDRLCLPLPLYTDMLFYIMSCNKVVEHKSSVKMSQNLSPLRQSF